MKQFENPQQHLKDMFLEIQIKMGKYITCIIIITHHKTSTILQVFLRIIQLLLKPFINKDKNDFLLQINAFSFVT